MSQRQGQGYSSVRGQSGIRWGKKNTSGHPCFTTAGSIKVMCSDQYKYV